MSSVVSNLEQDLLEQSATEFGSGVVNLGREASLFPTGDFTLSATFELNNLNSGLQTVVWNPRQFGIRIKDDDLKITLRGDDGRLHTTTISDAFDDTGWHDVQVVMDEDAGTLAFWLDGAVVYAGSSDGVNLTSRVYRDVTAGGRSGDRYMLDGQVADVAVVDEALTIDPTQSLFDRMLTMAGETPPIEEPTPEPTPVENTPADISGDQAGLIQEADGLEATGQLIVEDVDAGESNFVAATQQGVYGTFSMTSDGAWTYTATEEAAVRALGGNDQATETFVVQSIDGTSQNVIITIDGADEAPIITGDLSGIITEDVTQSVSGTLTADDADAGESGFRADAISGTYGDFSIDTAGDWIYAARDTDQFQSLEDGDTFVETFVATTLDGTEQVIEVSVNGTSEPTPPPSEGPAETSTAPVIGTAGIPIDLAMTRDYDQIFQTLSDSGIDVFCPLTIYEEYPEVKSLGFEADFFPPPYGSATPELYDLARLHGIKIAFSADIMYPLGGDMPPATQDPLHAILDAGGRDIIHSIFNYDEPVLRGISSTNSQAVYEHIKSIDPSIDVQQVHAPVGPEADPSDYLSAVLDHATWSDTVGFDVYPIHGQPGAQSPLSGGEIVEPVQSLQEYVSWLETNLADKSHVMVLQAFELGDLFSDEALATFSAEEQAASRPPTELEMRAMLNAVSDVDSVYWFGPSFLESQSDPTWQGALSVSEMMASGAENTSIEALLDIDTSANLIDEDAEEGDFTGVQLSANDPDAIDVVTYTLDDDRFYIDSEGHLRVGENAAFDFETEASISINATARSTDGSEERLDVVLNVNDKIDIVDGTLASDEITGASGADRITAMAGDDVVAGLDGDDVIFGGAGSDIIYGGAGNDDVSGGDGIDAIVGEAGNDTLFGDANDDYLSGGDGEDVLMGGSGADQLTGDAGADRISGNIGDDTMQGGEDNDIFIFANGDGNDLVLDFAVGQDALLFEGGITAEDLSISALSEHTQITYGDDSVVLIGVAEADWGNINFLFE
ncbi:VCBS domain-containing protein [Sneathiella sp.]|jgi:VCBS repeat-containing protein|uniref:VCBS domain-containing protein n=1 Tax=Sneathiella sp. TaxID=1964365 RepID=UPI0039E52E34